MEDISEIHRDINGTARKMLDEITAFQSTTERQESIDKEKIIQKFDEMTNNQSQAELYNLMRWAKTQQEKCKNFDQNLETTKNAARALDETIDYGIRNMDATMNEWSHNLFKARSDFLSLTTKFNELFESFRLSQKISGVDMRGIDVPSLKLETRLATNDEMKTMTLEDQLKQMQARERYYMSIINAAQKLALQMKLELTNLTSSNEQMHNNITSMEKQMKEMSKTIEEKTNKADEYFKAVVRMNELSTNRNICSCEDIDIVMSGKELTVSTNEVFDFYEEKQNVVIFGENKDENSMLDDDEFMQGNADNIDEGKANSYKRGAQIKETNEVVNPTSPRDVKTSPRKFNRSPNSRDLGTASGKRKSILVVSDENDENDFVANNSINENEASQTMDQNSNDLRIIIPTEDDNSSSLFDRRSPDQPLPSSPNSDVDNNEFSSSSSFNCFQDYKTSSRSIKSAGSAREMLAVPFNESFDSSKKQPLTPSTAYKKSRGNIVSPKCLTPRNNAIKHLREMIAKERMEAKLRMQALPNPFQIIHLDI